MSDEQRQKLQETGLVEWSVFSELVAMDEDEEGFSKSLFQTFVDQVLDTFQQLDENLKEKNLDKLSALGHYLKGSAAALGLTTISTQCERIQNYGHKFNFDNFELTADDIRAPSGDSIPNETDNDTSKSNDKSNEQKAAPSTLHNKSPAIPAESSDEFWIALIQDALNKAREGFVKSRAALNEYFDDEL
ncbi:putative response regulator phosphotransferase [Scheffersomyces xylosifermentans]|uniref:putative response regulator phosphotransferase n=1 Tax=Scheffersomyces xylosifermentans TaxID=1304137 RepID=UPI00315D3B54